MNTLTMITMIEHREQQARRLNHRSASAGARTARQLVGAILLAVGVVGAIRSFDPFQLTLAHAAFWVVAVLGAGAIALQPRD